MTRYIAFTLVRENGIGFCVGRSNNPRSHLTSMSAHTLRFMGNKIFHLNRHITTSASSSARLRNHAHHFDSRFRYPARNRLSISLTISSYMRRMIVTGEWLRLAGKMRKAAIHVALCLCTFTAGGDSSSRIGQGSRYSVILVEGI